MANSEQPQHQERRCVVLACWRQNLLTRVRSRLPGDCDASAGRLLASQAPPLRPLEMLQPCASAKTVEAFEQ
jgi:hypothetical protein